MHGLLTVVVPPYVLTYSPYIQSGAIVEMPTLDAWRGVCPEIDSAIAHVKKPLDHADVVKMKLRTLGTVYTNYPRETPAERMTRRHAEAARRAAKADAARAVKEAAALEAAREAREAEAAERARPLAVRVEDALARGDHGTAARMLTSAKETP